MTWYLNTYNNYPFPHKFSRLSSHIIMLLVLEENHVSNSVLERNDQTTNLDTEILHQKWSMIILSKETQSNAAQHKCNFSFFVFERQRI